MDTQRYIKIRGFIIYKNFGISRVESISGFYWIVRLNFINKKPQIQKIFPDYRYGDKFVSFKEAAIFRDSKISDSVLRRNQLRVSVIENFNREYWGTESFKKVWKKEKFRRRILAINKYGRKTIYLGTGIGAAKKARGMGASNSVCWNIQTGKQDSYKIFGNMPGLDLAWKNRKLNKKADIKKQKQIGKKKIILGVGREAALRAQELGASKQTCLNIYRGKQNFFQCCYSILQFEANGFKREVPKEIVDKIQALTFSYGSRAFEIAAEVIINYSSRDSIPLDSYFLKALVNKYAKHIKHIERKDFIQKGQTVSLDLNGDIER